jgi:hypothetical protein
VAALGYRLLRLALWRGALWYLRRRLRFGRFVSGALLSLAGIVWAWLSSRRARSRDRA